VPPTPTPTPTNGESTGHRQPEAGRRRSRRTGPDAIRARGRALVAVVLVVVVAGLVQRRTDRVPVAVVLLGVQLLGVLALTLLAIDVITLRKAQRSRERHQRDPVHRRR